MKFKYLQELLNKCYTKDLCYQSTIAKQFDIKIKL